MCGRYALFQTEKLRDRFNLANGLPAGVKPRYNIGPTQLEPIIVDRNGEPTVELMKWGFVPRWAKDTNSVFRYKTFNARSEGIFEKATWKKAIRHSRCLVPANGFYEWQTTDDGKQPYFIRPADNELFSFAGVYSSWQDADGVDWGTYSIVTTEPNEEMKSIHNRMPVILNRADEPVWLDPANDDMNVLYDLMRPYPNGKLMMDMVSKDVNTVRVDDARLVAPLNTR
jgi:putative SOS response-associated peptidase YedK